ncbi:PhzF family phenazine biosynthesis protein [Streptomyces sp. NPDC002467]|uniref:PhzF family phenazine biosynthesis protein n=1 Tax=Streptomyces sp. NPDC002467 TaxID=3364647 RepID=UPI003684A42B
MNLVRACLRDGVGGSPTAVVEDDGAPSDEDRRLVAAERGTSHAVFPRVPRRGAPGPSGVRVRFFTSEGELPACGPRYGRRAGLPRLPSGDRGRARARVPGHPPYVRSRVRRLGGAERGVLLRELRPRPRRTSYSHGCRAGPRARAARRRRGGCRRGGTGGGGGPGAADGAVASRAALAALDPDLDGLRDACDRLGLPGAYAHSPPSPTGGLAARMFAPSIGVPEDNANANGTARLAALLARRGTTRIAVDMGDAVGSPATITATARPGPSGVRIRVGGTATAAGLRVAGRPEA